MTTDEVIAWAISCSASLFHPQHDFITTKSAKKHEEIGIALTLRCPWSPALSFKDLNHG